MTNYIVWQKQGATDEKWNVADSVWEIYSILELHSPKIKEYQNIIIISLTEKQISDLNYRVKNDINKYANTLQSLFLSIWHNARSNTAVFGTEIDDFPYIKD